MKSKLSEVFALAISSSLSQSEMVEKIDVVVIEYDQQLRNAIVANLQEKWAELNLQRQAILKGRLEREEQEAKLHAPLLRQFEEITNNLIVEQMDYIHDLITKLLTVTVLAQ